MQLLFIYGAVELKNVPTPERVSIHSPDLCSPRVSGWRIQGVYAFLSRFGRDQKPFCVHREMRRTFYRADLIRTLLIYELKPVRFFRNWGYLI